MSRNRTCRTCHAPLGQWATWVGGHPYCVEHAEARRLVLEARKPVLRVEPVRVVCQNTWPSPPAPDPLDHGPGCDGPWNCVCQPIPDECPAGGEHLLTEVTTIPLGPSGRCEVLIVCEVCGAEIGPAGTDSVL